MITANEKQRLMEQYRDDAQVCTGAGLKCAAGIAILAIILGIGAHTGATDSAPEEGAVASSGPSGTTPSIADSQRLMEERRERFNRKAAPSGLQAAPLHLEARKHAEPNKAAVDEITLLLRSSD